MGRDDMDEPVPFALFVSTGTNHIVDGPVYYIYLGSDFNDGQWHYLEFDLAAYLAEADPGAEALHVVDFVGVIGNDFDVADLVLSQGTLKKSYQLVPGAPLGGYLGAQSGAMGGLEASGKGPWSRWYYQYNEMGSVMFTTEENGNPVSLDEPDYYGNYSASASATLGSRPDTLGLTSKFLNTDLNLYYFNARWYDPVRGRWLSVSSLPKILEMDYEFPSNMPYGFVDFDGYWPWAWPPSRQTCILVATGAGGLLGAYLGSQIGLIKTGAVLGGALGLAAGSRWCPPAPPPSQTPSNPNNPAPVPCPTPFGGGLAPGAGHGNPGPRDFTDDNFPGGPVPEQKPGRPPFNN